MILTEEQKDLIFYVLEGFMDSLYWDDEFNEIDYSQNSITFNMNAINEIKQAKVSLREFQRFIEKTMDDLCK